MNIFKKLSDKINSLYAVQNYRKILPYVRPYWIRALLAVLITIPIGFPYRLFVSFIISLRRLHIIYYTLTEQQNEKTDLLSCVDVPADWSSCRAG